MRWNVRVLHASAFYCTAHQDVVHSDCTAGSLDLARSTVYRTEAADTALPGWYVIYHGLLREPVGYAADAPPCSTPRSPGLIAPDSDMLVCVWVSACPAAIRGVFSGGTEGRLRKATARRALRIDQPNMNQKLAWTLAQLDREPGWMVNSPAWTDMETTVPICCEPSIAYFGWCSEDAYLIGDLPDGACDACHTGRYRGHDQYTDDVSGDTHCPASSHEVQSFERDEITHLTATKAID